MRTCPSTTRLERWLLRALLLVAGVCCGATPLRAQTQPDSTFVRIDDMLFVVPSISAREAGTSAVAAPRSTVTPWRGGTVPIEFTSAISDDNRAAILSACVIWSKRASVGCVIRSGQTPFLRVTADASSGCFATIGATSGREPARMNLDTSCWMPKTILHELGHVFGLQHEHQRADRDAYIAVDAAAVIPSYLGAFDPLPGPPRRGAYDFMSVMHYHDFAFGAQTLTRTLLPRPGFERYTYSLGGSDFPSLGDAEALQEIYGGGGTYWPAHAQNLRVTGGGASGVRLEWDPPVGGPDVTQYAVTVYAGATYLQSAMRPPQIVPSSDTGITLNLQPGYYFAVVKGDSADGECARSVVLGFSVSAGNVTAMDLAPGQPRLSVAGIDETGRITLDWRPGGGAPASLYTVYAGTRPGGNDLGSFPIGTSTSVVTSPFAGVVIFMRVVASNAIGAATSNEVSFQVTSPPAAGGSRLTERQVAVPLTPGR
jgi:hypothetical protein